MNRKYVDTRLSDFESLLAIERELVPESDELRRRVIERARATLPRARHARFALESPTPRGIRIGVAAAGGILLSALCFAAFYAGYQMRNRSVPREVTDAPAPVTVPSVLPASTELVVLAPATTTLGVPRSSADTKVHDAGSVPGKPTVSPRTTPEIEVYALELQVLQPARLAVAQRDFSRALSAIAEHQRKFPSGKLTEEREALRVKALLGLGRVTEAKRAGTAFRTRFPRSALLGRIDEMLGAPK